MLSHPSGSGCSQLLPDAASCSSPPRSSLLDFIDQWFPGGDEIEKISLAILARFDQDHAFATQQPRHEGIVPRWARQSIGTQRLQEAARVVLCVSHNNPFINWVMNSLVRWEAHYPDMRL